MSRGLRRNLLLSQAVVLILLMIAMAVFLTTSLDRILFHHMDLVLHQQADNFMATLHVDGNQLSFHDLNPDFTHSRPLSQEIPFHVQMLDPLRRTVMLSGNSRGQNFYDGSLLPMDEEFRTIRRDGQKVRMLSTPIQFEGRHFGWVLVTLSYEYLKPSRNQLIGTTTFATAMAILLLILSNFWFVRRSLAPVKRMSRLVDERARRDELDPLPVPPGQDEFAELTMTFNALLDRTQKSIQSLERFSADASHELKTPLAVLRTELLQIESDLQGGRTPELQQAHEELNRMQQLIENLLVLSQTDQNYQLHSEEIWLNDFIADEVSRYEFILKEKHLRFDLSQVESIKLRTDVYLLYLIINNLLVNAARHTGTDSTIAIRTIQEEDTLQEIQVLDEGPGIPDERLAEMFERFVRMDPNRSRESGGVGLGLSIANWAAGLLGARIHLENRKTGGLRARLLFNSSQ